MRKSTREKRDLIYTSEYITAIASTKCAYPLSDSISYANMSSAYQNYLQAFSCVVEPNTYKEACTNPKWIAAMKDEIKALKDNKLGN